MKVGDRVRCVDALGSCGCLVVGAVYTVSRCLVCPILKRDMVNLVEVAAPTNEQVRTVHGDWFVKRFEVIGDE